MSESPSRDHEPATSQPQVAALVDDLYFMSILSTAARHLKVQLAFPKPFEPIPQGTSLVVLDLDSRRDWEQQIAPFVAAGGFAIAFGPHVDVERRRRAKAAGCRRVLAKSRFVTEVSNILMSLTADSGKADRTDQAPDPVSSGGKA